MPARLNIFISHKSEDKQTALRLREILGEFDDDETRLMEFFLSEEITGGEKWYEWITSKLKSSNLLILLFTDPTLNWDWCLYEAGLFDLLDGAHHRRTICLHSPATEPPAPLKHLQAYPANPEGINTFLKHLFVKTDLTGLDQPIAKWLDKAPEKKDKAAKEISHLINREPETKAWHTKYMFIHVSNPKKIKPDHIPPDAKVMTTEKTLYLFDRPEGEWSWGDLEKKVRQKDDQRWLDELAMAMKAVAQGDLPEPIQALFHPLRGSMLYRPIIYRADKLADGSIKYKILLLEDVSWQVSEAPRNLRSLLTSLIMATRFRYELLQKYLDHEGELINGMPKEDICRQIQNVIFSIESEASSRGLLDKNNLTRIFATKEERKIISDIFDGWYSVRGALFDELNHIKCDTVEAQLNKLSVMNTQYLLLAVNRFQSLLEEEKAALPN